MEFNNEQEVKSRFGEAVLQFEKSEVIIPSSYLSVWSLFAYILFSKKESFFEKEKEAILLSTVSIVIVLLVTWCVVKHYRNNPGDLYVVSYVAKINIASCIRICDRQLMWLVRYSGYIYLLL